LAWKLNVGRIWLSSTWSQGFGDYNGNGVVDAADYNLARHAQPVGAGLAADGNHNTDAGDWDVWTTNFGLARQRAAAQILSPAARWDSSPRHSSGFSRCRTSPLVRDPRHSCAALIVATHIVRFEQSGRLVHWILLADSLEEQIRSRSALVGVVGLGGLAAGASSPMQGFADWV
jgi:hypothetical protein